MGFDQNHLDALEAIGDPLDHSSNLKKHNWDK